MPEPAGRLSELLVPVARLALVGLAKNTGKTETLAAILAGQARAGRPVGVTSIGRDGEQHDVLDARIDKPPIRLVPGSLVASTGGLLRASGARHERLSRTGVRTPLGEVVIARMLEDAAVEVAGPSAASDAHAVSEEMLALGARQVLIDGAIDRRAASSPDVADALVLATGAVLGEDVEQVVSATVAAVELIRLPVSANGDGRHVALRGRVALNGEPEQITALLEQHPAARSFVVEGALGENFLEGLLAARRRRGGAHELRIIARDPTKVFLSRRPPSWYRRQGLAVEVLAPINLRAITINPVAPQSHRLDSRELREAIAESVGEVPVLDVRAAAY
jgi:hypothetical protein